jgi:hypothetical protein
MNALEEVQNWWQNATPEMRAAFQTGGLVVAALLGGHFLGSMVARALRARNFDAALRLPRSSAPGAEDHGITPTFVAGLLIRLTVWAGAGWWFAQQHGRADLAKTLALIISRTWAFASMLTAALGLGGMLARRLMECLQSLPKVQAPARNGAPAPRWDVAGAVGAGVYFLVALLVLMIAADLFDLPLTRTATQALWQFTQNALIACAALVIGCLGASWARDLSTPEGTSTPEKRAGQYTALGIMGATTVLAVAVLLTSAGVLIGLAALAILGLLLWLVRGYLPDVTAGLQLRVHKVCEVWLDGEPWQVSEIGFLSTQVGRRGEFCRLQNRQVLQALLQGAPAEAAPR